MKGKVHSLETFAAADGPGVRFLVFLSGCGFRCAYCHNPDTWARPAALELSPQEVLARALRYKAYWGERGGITVSGGEPMLQPDFVSELFETAHERGINTCLDTAAGPFDRNNASIRRMLSVSDTVLLDIKHIDAVKHLTLTGCDNAPVLDCAQYLAEIGKTVWIRHVLVPGVTDGDDDLRRLGEFVRSLPNVARVDVLPYHTLGVAKWRALGLAYRLEDVREPSSEALERARRLLENG